MAEISCRPPTLMVHRLIVPVDGLLLPGDGGNWLDRHPDHQQITVGNAGQDAAGIIARENPCGLMGSLLTEPSISADSKSGPDLHPLDRADGHHARASSPSSLSNTGSPSPAGQAATISTMPPKVSPSCPTRADPLLHQQRPLPGRDRKRCCGRYPPDYACRPGPHQELWYIR